MASNVSHDVDNLELMSILSRPRPNGSQALRETCNSLCTWLDAHHIPHKLHTYQARPYLLETMGAWLIVSQLLLDVSIWLRWGWPTILIAVISLVVMQLEAKEFPVLSWLGRGQSENIVISFAPLQPPQREIILSAHYDSKTELLDHHQRAFLLRRLPLAAGLTLLLGILGLIDEFLGQSSNFAYFIGIVLSIPHLILMSGMGANFLFGRLAQPSQGAVDNGASCAILLNIADWLANQRISLKETAVTIVLFSGEEVAAQGSTAYVSDRKLSLPTIALNLELCGQNGPYIAWEKYGGSSAPIYQATPAMTEAVAAAVSRFDKEFTIIEGPVGTDTVPFLAAGIAAISLGTMDRKLGVEGLHRPTDNLERVVVSCMPETTEIVAHILAQYDNGFLLSE